ncbi:2-polyprenyl-6-methoxyphenol hydroxylase [Actinopolymorpha cephalotaxi]|uniref:2-polyprenyl-6-methoxyphenol hydroxylase n=1 Tax=Actinopolymorpha cephalotaxi TaxID=504797 RepID=A0A1I2LRS2_9ACTN|nr:FAD-dependent oxidoreductase [Actinopolymorpha cephalotaxi]NYH81329.1 2-polyprenyl-6-methoxyphenol hydroxylase-like FAD-dependent oxidoreductase [Actinopolymorpha cephalotaxi]SFF79766.1 2-polyprenyl-6-methoxyphenol hydroxylase [Actinopolymorpha cephalotaxi]
MPEPTVCVAGGGPAGVMLGLLLARAGIRVTVLEKHADFLRDFRGDTVHPSTLEVLAELGLADRLEEIPHQRVERAGFEGAGRRVDILDLRRLRVRHPYIALVPQWDFLELLAAAASAYPEFELRREAEAYDLVVESGRVVGVRFRDRGGDPGDGHVLRAALTVAADGRHSTLRRAAGLTSRAFGAPIDVVWFRLPWAESDSAAQALTFRFGPGRAAVTIPRRTYWQIAYLIRKGGFEDLRGQGIDALRQGVAQTVPFLADRVGELRSFDDTSVLEVRMDRLRRWYRPGLLAIGDAAHAMSPVAGVGINLAVQDAVAAANLLVPSLREAQRSGVPVPDRALAAVQRRRQLPTAVTQAFQRAVQTFGLNRALRADPGASPAAPVPAWLAPVIRRPMSRFVGLGVRPEHVRTRPD